jgi:antibiotic biosynthesis monooxygenase (ABM) superfamily enzyme
MRIWAAVTVAGLYPVLLALVTVVGAVVPQWPAYARLAVIAPLAVAWIVWGFAPIQRRILARWN